MPPVHSVSRVTASPIPCSLRPPGSRTGKAEAGLPDSGARRTTQSPERSRLTGDCEELGVETGFMEKRVQECNGVKMASLRSSSPCKHVLTTRQR